MLKKNNTYVSEGGPIQTYRSIFMKSTLGKNSLGLTNSRYNELFSGSLQSSLYRDSTVFSLRNTKNFRTCEPFKFSNARFFFPYQTVEQFSNAIFVRQIKSQNLQRKNLGFSENVFMFCKTKTLEGHKSSKCPKDDPNLGQKGLKRPTKTDENAT